MLRPVLLGLLVVSASACGKSTTESSAKVQPGVAAGKVLEVKGAVTVKHGADTRPLALGDSVEGDDTVVTGADGNVVIELAHNSARWELGANKSQRVRDSIAWNAKKATAEEIDQATAAAGRPAERSAAGTVAMEGEAAAPAEEAPAAAAPAAPAPEREKAADDYTPKGGSAPTPPRRRVATKRAASAAPEKEMAPAPPPPPPAEEASDDSFRPARTRGPIAKAAPPAPSAPTTAAAPSASVAPPAPASAPVAAPPPTPSVLVGAKAAALQKCMKDAGATADVTLVVDVANGQPTVAVSSKAAVSAGLEKCIKGVISGISFTSAVPSTAKVTRVLKP